MSTVAGTVAEVLGIVVDGGTVAYLVYKGGRWTWENHERLLRRGRLIQVEITDKLGVTDSIEPKIHKIEVSTASPSVVSLNAAVDRREPPHSKKRPLEDMAWWYLRVRFS